jgi:hypothetical protein
MRQPRRTFGTLTATTVALSGLGLTLVSCNAVKGRTAEDDSALTGTITSVRLDNGSGAVSVTGVPDGTALSVHRKYDYRGHKPVKTAPRVEDGVLVLGGCGAKCSVDYTVRVPAGIPVTGRSSNGAVHLSHVGAVTVTSGNGRVDMDGVTGAVHVGTGNGTVTAKGLTGGAGVQVTTSNGRVDLALGAPADVQVTTSNGAATLTVPHGSYRVSATTRNGHKDVTVPDDPAGRNRLDVRTANGALTVRQS